MFSKASSVVPEPLTPELVFVVAVAVARVVLVHHEGGDALVLLREVDVGEDDRHVGVGAVGDEDLVAVEDVVVAVAPRGGAQGRRVAAGARLGEREAADQLARRERLQELFLDPLAAELQQRVADQRVVHRKNDAGRSADPADLFDHQAIGDGVHAGAAILLRHANAHQAHLARLAHRVAREDPLGVGLLGDRLHHLLGKAANLLLQHLLFVTELDKHKAPGDRGRSVDYWMAWG